MGVVVTVFALFDVSTSSAEPATEGQKTGSAAEEDPPLPRGEEGEETDAPSAPADDATDSANGKNDRRPVLIVESGRVAAVIGTPKCSPAASSLAAAALRNGATSK